MSLTGSIPFKLYRPLALNASGAGVNVAALAGTFTMTWLDEQFQQLDPDGAHRDVALPTPDPEHRGCFFCFYNSANAAENLVVKSGVSTIVTLGQGESAIVAATSSAWKIAVAMPASASLTGTANTWDLLQTFTVGALIQDAGYLGFGTPGTDVVFTANGTDLVVTGTGQVNYVDSFLSSWGTGKDIAFSWDGTRFNVTQAAPNSEIRWGVDGAGIDQMWYGDTAGAYVTWDQSADSFILGGVAKIKSQTIAAATGTAIPVTHSGSFPITTAGAETNTLADPTFLGQWLNIFVDTFAVGARVITAASRINQAANTIITLGEVGDFIKLEAISIAGALKWQVVSNDGAVLS